MVYVVLSSFQCQETQRDGVEPHLEGGDKGLERAHVGAWSLLYREHQLLRYLLWWGFHFLSFGFGTLHGVRYFQMPESMLMRDLRRP